MNSQMNVIMIIQPNAILIFIIQILIFIDDLASISVS